MEVKVVQCAGPMCALNSGFRLPVSHSCLSATTPPTPLLSGDFKPDHQIVLVRAMCRATMASHDHHGDHQHIEALTQRSVYRSACRRVYAQGAPSAMLLLALLLPRLSLYVSVISPVGNVSIKHCRGSPHTAVYHYHLCISESVISADVKTMDGTGWHPVDAAAAPPSLHDTLQHRSPPRWR